MFRKNVVMKAYKAKYKVNGMGNTADKTEEEESVLIAESEEVAKSQLPEGAELILIEEVKMNEPIQ